MNDVKPQGVEPKDYAQKVYAGVLGKIIGVYSGKPFEGWCNADIEKRLGEIWYYVHDRLNYPLVCPDDDISGTFTFLRAIEDHQAGRNITSQQIGKTWLNYLIENQTVLWWGGMGVSTGHTTWLRLSSGIPAPRSGSMELNGPLVAEQIGAQIFIDGFAMVAPNNPELAVKLAGQSAHVSHDGEAAYGAQMLAAMESAAFGESNMDRLFDIGLSHIPSDSLIAQIYADVRNWAAAHGKDWRATFRKIQAKYGYDRYGGGCHMIPNHAIMVMAWAHAPNEFQKSLMIANTAGWDTDCNAGNVGCLMGIKEGLAGIGAGSDWQTPIADRVMIPTAEGTHGVSDVQLQADLVARIGRQVMGWTPAAKAKDGARFHFTQPGSRHGFMPDKAVAAEDTIHTHNPGGKLIVQMDRVTTGAPARISTPTYILPEQFSLSGGSYSLAATPTLYSGQKIVVRLIANSGKNLTARLYVRYYQPVDESNAAGKQPVISGYAQSEAFSLPVGQPIVMQWTVPDTHGWPIATVGLGFEGENGSSAAVAIDSVDWTGAAKVNFSGLTAKAEYEQLLGWIASRPKMCCGNESGALRLMSNHDTGLLHTGNLQWVDYRVAVTIKSRLANRVGIAVRYGGLYRYVAMVYNRMAGELQFVQQYDESQTILAATKYQCELNTEYTLQVDVSGDKLIGSINQQKVLEATISKPAQGTPLDKGGIALLCDGGTVTYGDIRCEPLG